MVNPAFKANFKSELPPAPCAVHVRPHGISYQVPYVVENVDPSHRVYFRQRGADWCPWQSVGPGEKQGSVGKLGNSGC